MRNTDKQNYGYTRKVTPTGKKKKKSNLQLSNSEEERFQET